MELHTERLLKLCKICRKIGRVSHDCRYTLRQCGLDPAVPPPRFCNSCYLTMKFTLKARQDGSAQNPSFCTPGKNTRVGAVAHNT